VSRVYRNFAIFSVAVALTVASMKTACVFFEVRTEYHSSR
jgi:hypothetical protein